MIFKNNEKACSDFGQVFLYNFFSGIFKFLSVERDMNPHLQ